MRHGVLLAALSFALISFAQDLPQTTPSPCLCADLSECHHTSSFMKSEDTCFGLTVTSEKNTGTDIVNCNGTLLDCGKLPKVSYEKGRVLKHLTIENCEVDSLSCVLPALNASDVKTLNYSVSTPPLTADALTGFNMVQNLYLNGRSNVPNTIPVEAFKSLPNIRILRLADFGLIALPPYTFKTAPTLSFLDINSNNIKILQADAFNGLGNLKTLEMYKNHIEEIDANAFRGLESLEVLYLYENSLDVLHSGIFSGVPLREITLVKNQGALRLQTGALSGLDHLEKVILQSDELILEPASLSLLPILRSANIQNSGVKTLPADLFLNTTALIDLNLSRNKLRSLSPTVFKSLSNLRKLNLSHNLLERVDRDVFEPLQQLRELYLDGNLIQVLNEKTFYSLKDLSIVNLSGNIIDTVHDWVFPRAITRLDLSENRLDWCSPDKIIGLKLKTMSPLGSLQNLKQLNLRNNSISDVCSDWINEMLLLQTLDLSHNNITILEGRDINFVSHNIEVNFQDNPITTIKNLNANFTQSILLGRNSFNCDCELFGFLLQSKNHFGQAMCESPRSLNGCSLDSIARGGECKSRSVSLLELTCPVEAPSGCECLVRPAGRRTECDCETIPDVLPHPTDNEQTQMKLRLRSLQNSTLIFPRFVTMLNLSGLRLESVPDLPTNVTFVDLSNNSLGRVPVEFLQRNLSMKLEKNPLECDCWNAKNVENLQTYQTKIEDYNTTLRCNNGNYVHGIEIATLCYTEYLISFCSGLTILCITIAITISLCYKYNLEIRLWLSKIGCPCFMPDKEDKEDRKKKYDIFLSYVHQDEKFVKETFLPKLDSKYKVCIHSRDWIVGESILDQIYRSVANSRRTLILLSNEYIQSGTWAQEEFRAAYLQTAKDGRPRCVVVLLEDVKLDNAPENIQLNVKLNTYIQWGDVLFWPRLYDAIPKVLTADHVRRRWLTEKAWRILSGGRSPNVVHEEIGLIGVPVLQSPPQA